MTKIVRPKLARATKLLVEHQDGSVGAVANKLRTAAVGADDIEASWGICRVTYHVPLVGHKFFDSDKCSFTMPLVLPPLQDDWDATAGRNVMPRVYVLDELGLSFDTRNEPAAVECESSATSPSPNAGRMNYDAVGQYDFHLKVMEKQQLYFNTAAGKVPTAEIASLRFTPEQFASRGFRDNPFTLAGISKQIQPYRTYVLDFSMPPPSDDVGLVSLLVTLKLRVRLRSRYVGEQNRPFYAGGIAPTVAYTPPVGNAPITAAVQTNIEAVDAQFKQRLDGGVTTEGLSPPTATLPDVGCYNVLAVPMWGNFNQHLPAGADKRVMDYSMIAAGQYPPYYQPLVGAPGDPPTYRKTFDVRRIPLIQPWAIHHVIVCRNRMDPTIAGVTVEPQSATYYEKVTVEIASNARSDGETSQVIAEGDSSAGTMPFFDLLRNRADGQNCGQGPATLAVQDWELCAIPLVGAGGTGYVAQGEPVFVGRTNSGANPRQNLNGAPPTMDGRETELRVTYEIGNPAMLDAPDEDPQAVFVGYGGHWVLLCGQKYLAGAPNDVPA